MALENGVKGLFFLEKNCFTEVTECRVRRENPCA